MNKHTILGAAACLLACATAARPGVAQIAQQYSYITDRTFTSPDQLMGYDFRPAMRELPGEEPEETPVGKYSFGVTRNNLFVEGPGIRGVYSVNNVDQTDYGFILKTMNARDPTIQGHLKIVTDELGYVEGLIFKRSNDDPEVIFFLRVIPVEVEQFETEYFTDYGEQRVASIDSLWTGVEVRPFFRVYQEAGVQQRITPADSVYLSFYKVVTVEERERGAMAAIGLGKKGKRRTGSGATVEAAIADLPSEPIAMAGGVADAQTQRAVMLATLQAGMGAEPDSGRGHRDLIAAVAAAAAGPAVDSAAAAAPALPDGVPVTPDVPIPDDVLMAAALQSPDSVAALASREHVVARSEASEAAAAAAAEARAQAVIDSFAAATKYKVTDEYFVDINSYVAYDDGTSAMSHKTFNVHAITEREDEGAAADGDRFQWELALDRKRVGYIYLDGYRRINSVEIDGQKFSMRGK